MQQSQTARTRLEIVGGLARGIYDPAVANHLLVEQTGTSLASTLEVMAEQVETIIKAQ